MEDCYLEHYTTVQRALSRMLSGVDLENQIHELFYRLITDEKMRRGFRGGSLAGWLTVAARNQAIDFLRRKRREIPVEPREATRMADEAVDPVEDEELASRLLDDFRRQVPRKWLSVFETRFVRQLNQSEAARELGVGRTTLAYREKRILARLRKYLAKQEESE